jgi:hypothetical protein
MTFHEMFRTALDNKDDPVMKLRQVVLDLRAEGVEKNVILSELRTFRDIVAVKGEDDEDVVVEVISFLVGWCGPSLRID